MRGISTQILRNILKRRLWYAEQDGEHFLDAELDVRDAERYYGVVYYAHALQRTRLTFYANSFVSARDPRYHKIFQIGKYSTPSSGSSRYLSSLCT